METNTDENEEGKEILPPSLSLNKFVSSRMHEIAALTEVIEDTGKGGLGIQQLPRHMRRRAMGHNAKRVPKSMRDVHLAMLAKSGLKETPSKKPRRKYRRRPSNLLSEYNRRQREFVWLETHIWHAKRFHMAEKWGYKIAEYPNDKCFRACYRATANHCLLQDISYYICIELCGEEQNLLEGLSKHTSHACGLTFKAKSTLSGNREGRLTFFEQDMYPKGAIGEVSFMWRPVGSHSKFPSRRRQLWIWSHPSFYEQVVHQLVSTFGLKEVENKVSAIEDDTTIEENVPRKKRKVEEIKLEIKGGKLSYFSDLGVTMAVLKDKLNRLRLQGPLSQSVLVQAFRLADLNVSSSSWVGRRYSGEEAELVSTRQSEFWKAMEKIANPGQISPSLIFSLVVVDPRLNFPAKRTKEVVHIEGDEVPDVEGWSGSESPLWNEDWREAVTREKPSTTDYCALRQGKLVPGLSAEVLDTSRPIPTLPIILVHQPASPFPNKRIGLSSGWDLIVPAGWAMPCWLGLIFRGARPGGLRDATSLRREANLRPMLEPDTKAGAQQEAQEEKMLLQKYFGLPPAKRPNFIKLCVGSPFRCAWEELGLVWENSSEPPIIVRDLNVLRQLAAGLDGKDTSSLEVQGPALIPVSLTIEGKGKISNLAVISVPKVGDLSKPPVEPHHPDPETLQRSTVRSQHSRQLKRLRRKHVDSSQAVAEHAACMQSLWLPKADSVREHLTRQTLGFVSQGAFCFSEACPAGQGYVSFQGFLHFLRQKFPKPLVLLRPIESEQYRLARIKVIC